MCTSPSFLGAPRLQRPSLGEVTAFQQETAFFPPKRGGGAGARDARACPAPAPALPSPSACLHLSVWPPSVSALHLSVPALPLPHALTARSSPPRQLPQHLNSLAASLPPAFGRRPFPTGRLCVLPACPCLHQPAHWLVVQRPSDRWVLELARGPGLSARTPRPVCWPSRLLPPKPGGRRTGQMRIPGIRAAGTACRLGPHILALQAPTACTGGCVCVSGTRTAACS